MIDEPTKNPELSFDQLQAIDVVQKRLSNLEAEIAIAAKNLSIEKKEVVKATKEREYQEELLAKLNAQVPALQAEKDKIEAAVKAGEERLAKIIQEDRVLKAEQTATAIQQTERENALRESEAKLAQQQDALRQENADLKAEKAKLAEFKEALLAVIKTW